MMLALVVYINGKKVVAVLLFWKEKAVRMKHSLNKIDWHIFCVFKFNHVPKSVGR